MSDQCPCGANQVNLVAGTDQERCSSCGRYFIARPHLLDKRDRVRDRAKTQQEQRNQQSLFGGKDDKS